MQASCPTTKAASKAGRCAASHSAGIVGSKFAWLQNRVSQKRNLVKLKLKTLRANSLLLDFFLSFSQQVLCFKDSLAHARLSAGRRSLTPQD